jgi:hypothetical protein
MQVKVWKVLRSTFEARGQVRARMHLLVLPLEAVGHMLMRMHRIWLLLGLERVHMVKVRPIVSRVHLEQCRVGRILRGVPLVLQDVLVVLLEPLGADRLGVPLVL